MYTLYVYIIAVVSFEIEYMTCAGAVAKTRKKKTNNCSWLCLYSINAPVWNAAVSRLRGAVALHHCSAQNHVLGFVWIIQTIIKDKITLNQINLSFDSFLPFVFYLFKRLFHRFKLYIYIVKWSEKLLLRYCLSNTIEYIKPRLVKKKYWSKSLSR